MSQYPSPYQGPDPSAFASYVPASDAYDQLLAPARRAGVLALVLGGIGMTCGLCLSTAIWAVPVDQVIQQLQITVPEDMGIPIEQFVRIVYTVAGVLALVAGVVMALLGIFIRRGRRGSIITAIVLCSLILLWLGVNVVASIPMLLRQPAQTASALVLISVPIALLALLLTWLVRALKAAAQVRAWQVYYQQLYWQYQQRAGP